jgi:4-phospho-D-threonate 3-dehydrogenase / 4-phospho-D-erythronate 3-dehydrogenase
MKTRIALTPGDFNGVGPEIILKSINAAHLGVGSQFILCAPATIFRFYANIFGLPCPPVVETMQDALKRDEHVILNCELFPSEVHPGEVSAQAGEVAMNCIRIAVNLCLEGHADAICTAPINKESIHLAGYKYPGHTEYLAALTGCERYTMMLVAQELRVGILTTHIPLHRVAAQITQPAILEKLRIMGSALRENFGISDPKIAVFGLNPHAGDGGVLGTEEIDIIIPALKTARMEGIYCEGPFAADGWFGNRGYLRYDAVLALYHDQGLAPFKAISFGKGVNFTAGLPIIRTSPDHGTAFDIAGKGIANTDSMFEAVRLADSLLNISKGIS